MGEPLALFKSRALIWLQRRIYRRGFTECISAVISALGYLPRWGNNTFYFRVRSLPGVIAKPLFGPNLDSTGGVNPKSKALVLLQEVQHL